MNTHVSPEDQFFHQSQLWLEYPGWGKQLVAMVNSSGVQISLEPCDLDRAKATALRDWLNEVLA